MKLPVSWLAEFVDPLPGVAELEELLPGLGLGVEDVQERPGAPAGVLVTEVERVTPIEGSDGLHETVAFDGRERRTVVCGAPNVRVGMRAALAPPGTFLPAADLTVDVRRLRGVESHGMLCSPKELGLYEDASGLLALPAGVVPGTRLAELWPAETVLELELTPNRADAFSVLGVARDLAAKLDRPLRRPDLEAVEAAAAAHGGGEAGDDALAVRRSDPDACLHLVLQRIDGVAPGPSPAWLQRRLAALGLRPRNNVVDVTNYVTFELGQPSHAYDLRVLEGATLEVRRAEAGESLTLLDESTVSLDPRDLVIARRNGDASRPIGLAGVMGGLEDSVAADTTAVALEAAHFDPPTIRATAKRHTLHSDAHYRFERGVDPALPPHAAARAAQLLAAVAGGRVHPRTQHSGGFQGRPEVRYRPDRVAWLTTLEVPTQRQCRYLEALGCEVRADDAEAWRVTPPSWRFDLSLEEDLVEEVARLEGYEHIDTAVPAMAFTPPPTDPTHRALREWLAASGLQEVINYVFTSDAELQRAAAPAAQVRLSNPQGVERSVLRTALHPALLRNAAANQGREALALFEIGRVFGREERERVALLLAGAFERAPWQGDRPADFWQLRGLLERLAETRRSELALEPVDAEAAPALHPGVAARVRWNGREVGVAGRLHPAVADAFELGETYLAELELPLEARTLRYREPERQPYAERDLAVVAPRDVPYAEVEALVRREAGELLREVRPFDVYEGAPLSEGQRSVALRLRFRHPERALTDEEVDARIEAVVNAVRGAGYAIRE